MSIGATPDHLTGHITTRIGHRKENLLAGERDDWEIIVGLEVHAQVSSESKLFSGSSTEFGAKPNSQVSLVDAAMPGMLPVINMECVRKAVLTGLGLGAKINLHSIFDRKNYFYPDLPQGYQISQFSYPIVGEGKINVDLLNGNSFVIGIERLHLEQDAGKSIHDQHPKKSYIDLNRSGVALMEIVSKPDLRSGEEAAAYLAKLRSILRYLGTCDGEMSKGSMRADVNVSVRHPGASLGTRCEIKNVNSLKFIRQAIDFEARRQIEIIENGGVVDQETRLFDSGRGETRSMRSKEEAHDYRYFPDPDLLPLVLEQHFVDTLKSSLPELPDAKKLRFIDFYGLSSSNADVLVSEKEVADFYECLVKAVIKMNIEIEKEVIAIDAANLVVNELFGLINASDIEIADSPISSLQIAEFLKLRYDGVISGRIGKELFVDMFHSGKDAAVIVEEKGMKQITDTDEIESIIDKLILDHPDQANQYRQGNTKVSGWFTGQAMKATKGQANPQLVNDVLKEKLEN